MRAPWRSRNPPCCAGPLTKQKTVVVFESVLAGASCPDPALRVDMMRVFGQLKPQQRQLMWLAYVEGASHLEIATALGLRERSVRVLLHRARRRLAALLRATGSPRIA